MALLPKPSVVLKQLQKTKRISRSRLVISQGDRLDLRHLEAVAENIGEENIRNKCIIDMLPGLGLWSHVLLQYQPQHIYAVENETQFDSYLQAICREYPDKFSLPHGRYCQEYLSQIRQKPSELAEFPSMAHTEPSSLMLTGALKAEKTHYSWLFHMVADSLDQANLYEYGRVQLNIFLPEDFVKSHVTPPKRPNSAWGSIFALLLEAAGRVKILPVDASVEIRQRLRQPVSTAIKALGKDTDYVLRTSAVNPDQLVAQLTLDDINRICMASAADY
ncbi:Dimethyladenosine transferase 2, mitochondrial [Dispira simplex]|nr:Dimethyladenosine transferase 2, mitochondrial [Dispira simplex]